MFPKKEMLIMASISPTFSTNIGNAIQSFNHAVGVGFKACEHIWSYGGKAVTLSRHLLTIISKTRPEYQSRIDAAILKIKLLNGVGIPFAVASTKSAVEKFIKSFGLGDTEGVTLSSLSVALNAMDITDATATVINSALAIAGEEKIALLSAVGTPLAYAMTTIGSVNRLVQIIKTGSVWSRINRECLNPHQTSVANDQEALKALKKYLTDNLNLTIEEQVSVLQRDPRDVYMTRLEATINKLIEKKKAIFTRSTSPEIIAKFEEMLQILKQTSITQPEIDQIFRTLDLISKECSRKIWVEIAGLVANAFAYAGLITLTLPVPPVLPFVFFAASTVIKIGMVAYQDLRDPAFPPTAPAA
jgi:hypothetical protein